MKTNKVPGLPKPSEWNDEIRNSIANNIRYIARTVPPEQSAYLNELALAIDNN